MNENRLMTGLTAVLVLVLLAQVVIIAVFGENLFSGFACIVMTVAIFMAGIAMAVRQAKTAPK